MDASLSTIIELAAVFRWTIPRSALFSLCPFQRASGYGDKLNSENRWKLSERAKQAATSSSLATAAANTNVISWVSQALYQWFAMLLTPGPIIYPLKKLKVLQYCALA